MHLYGLIIGIAIAIGIYYFEKHQTVIPKSKLLFFEVGLLVSAIVGARAYHVIDEWAYYSQNLSQIPATWNGGLGIFGAIFGALLFIFLFSLFSRISFLESINHITPILPLSQAIGRLGNWANQENPMWWPEAIGDLILFFIINRYPRAPTAKYLIGYGIIRFLTEFWRTETWSINNFKIGQLISVIFIFFGLLLIYRDRTKIS
jgi:phosphatidylglycerol:prolipoprotein diacylglycerol transferase